MRNQIHQFTKFIKYQHTTQQQLQQTAAIKNNQLTGYQTQKEKQKKTTTICLKIIKINAMKTYSRMNKVGFVEDKIP